MSPERMLFERSRGPLNLLGAAIFLALTLVFGSIYLRDSLKARVLQNQEVHAAQKATLETKHRDLQNVMAHIEQFRALKKQGLIGRADREGWVEQLVASRERLGIGNALVYNLKPAQAILDSTVADPNASAPTASATSLEPGAPQSHDLDFEISGVHEGELIAFLDSFRDQVRGRFRVQSCRLGRPTPDGLVAVCTLRFFNLPDQEKAK
ncbi:MAG: hypothetical protein IPM03_03415 [Sulfuritalea sp.]|nr:hypothetical protein [Sulfuritalea sp.]